MDLIGDGQVYNSGYSTGNISYLLIANGTAGGVGWPDCILGFTLLERYHVYFELFGEVGPGRVSFAQTPDTYGTFNTNWTTRNPWPFPK